MYNLLFVQTAIRSFAMSVKTDRKGLLGNRMPFRVTRFVYDGNVRTYRYALHMDEQLVVQPT